MRILPTSSLQLNTHLIPADPVELKPMEQILIIFSLLPGVLGVKLLLFV